MPTPSSSQAALSMARLEENPSSARPPAKIRLDAASTPRPPRASMRLPASGPTNAETTSAPENAANTHGVETPSSCAIASPSTPGR